MAHVRFSRFGFVLVAPILLSLAAATPVFARDIRHKPLARRITRASWYGRSFQGKRTASGGIFNPQRLTAAHRTINMGSKVRVTELRSGRSVVVQITDRGPFFPGRDIDLSYAAARELGIVRRGVARVRIDLLERERQATKAPVVTAFSGPTMSWLPRAIAE